MRGCIEKRLKQVGIVIFVLFYVVFLAGGIKLSQIFVYNHSNSLPQGLYLVVAADDVKRGDLVTVELPEEMKEYAIDRGWMKEGELLLKKIGGFAGTKYVVEGGKFFIDDRYVGPVYEKDGAGLLMPVRNGHFAVKEGCFLPIADQYPKSFDGRYFGDVPLESIHAKAVPILTTGWFY